MTTAAALLAGSVLAQIVWTFAVMLWAGRARFAAARAGRVDLARIALDSSAWPDDVRRCANNMNNQFETPTLFYALALLALVLGLASLPLALLGWGFVATRVLHSLAHAGRNDLMTRFRFFFAGVLMLMVMTILLAIDLVRGAAVS
ncbi:MAPEG family protein [Methylobrevis pamukkalensis]|uniref:MAPEG family protein n=1 Tax=Methylobrevis pamukkalensis TaxID=1439726 RepID=A0A1E3H3N5_9HYPH|nr:MAPEG family protein [Methylobrevis pamukkalensis]ODN70151.1 MAPEG family protein [Methylobrevis pamukkalensis]